MSIDAKMTDDVADVARLRELAADIARPYVAPLAFFSSAGFGSPVGSLRSRRFVPRARLFVSTLLVGLAMQIRGSQ